MLYTYEKGQNPRILTILNSGRDMEQQELSFIAGRNAKNSTATLKTVQQFLN